MNKIEYKQAVYVGDEFERWHYWGFMPDLTFVGPDMVNGIAHALANSKPFVCLDKNGDKVFSGDEIQCADISEVGGSAKYYVGYVKWNQEYTSFALYYGDDFELLHNLKDIELIKD